MPWLQHDDPIQVPLLQMNYRTAHALSSLVVMVPCIAVQVLLGLAFVRVRQQGCWLHTGHMPPAEWVVANGLLTLAGGVALPVLHQHPHISRPQQALALVAAAALAANLGYGGWRFVVPGSGGFEGFGDPAIDAMSRLPFVVDLTIVSWAASVAIILARVW